MSKAFPSKTMRMRILAWVAAGLALLSVAPASAQNFAVSPAVLRFSPGSDSAQVNLIQIRNNGKADLTLRLYLGDFDQTESGENRFLTFGQHPSTCQGRIEVYPGQLTLLPGEQQPVRVKMSPGAGVCWAVVFAEAAQRSTQGISIGVRSAVKVFAVPQNSVSAGEVLSTSASVRNDTVKVATEFLNSGTVPVRPAGRVEVRTADGQVVTAEDVEAFTVLPGSKRQVALAVPARLPSGRYVVVTILDFGGEYLVGGQATFDVKDGAPGPTSQSAVAGT